MRESGSNTAFERVPWPRAPALAKLHPEPGPHVRRAVQSPDTGKPFFAIRTEPARATSVDVSFGPFRLLRTQFLLLDADKPVPVGSRALEILISALRRMLRDGRNGNRFIINIPGRGYCFVAPVVVSGRVQPDGNENRAPVGEQSSALFAA